MRNVFEALAAPTGGLDELQAVYDDALSLGMSESRLKVNHHRRRVGTGGWEGHRA